MKKILIALGSFAFLFSHVFAYERPLTDFAKLQLEATNIKLQETKSSSLFNAVNLSKDVNVLKAFDYSAKNWFNGTVLPLPKTIYENDFVRRVLHRNPKIHMHETNIKASFWELPQTIGISTIIQKYTSFLEKAVGVPKLRSLFPTPGIFSLKSLIALQARNIAKAKYFLGCSNVAFKSRAILAKISYFKRLSKVLSEELNLMQELLDMANARYKNGSADFSDVMNMKAKKAIVFDALKEAKDNTLANIKAAWYLLDASDKLKFPARIKMVKYNKQNKLVGLVKLANHPEILILSSLKKKLEFSIKTIDKMKLTDGSSLNSLPLAYSGQYRAKSMSPYQVKGAPTNFIDFAHATQQELITRRVSKDFAISSKLQDLKEKLVNARTKWIIAKRQANVLQNTVIPKLLKAFNTVKSSYSSGNSTFEALILIEKQLIIAKKKLLKTRLDEQISGATFLKENGLVFPIGLKGK